MTTLTAARRQILDGLLAELAADERCDHNDRAVIARTRTINTRLRGRDAAEPDPGDDDAELVAALWDESGDRP